MTTTLSRRAWLTGTLGLATFACASRQSAMPGSAGPAASGPGPTIETVTGPIRADALGLTLMHEHVLVDFIGASEVSRSRYDADAVVRDGAAPFAAGAGARLRDARRVHAGLSRPRSAAPAAAVESIRRRTPVEHRVLRSGEGQARAAHRVHRDRRAACRALDSRGRARHRGHGDQAGVHEDRRR